MSKITAQVNVTPPWGGPQPNNSRAEADVGAITTNVLLLDDTNASDYMLLGASDVRFLYVFAEPDQQDATIEVTLSDTKDPAKAKEKETFPLNFPILIGGGSVKLLGNKKHMVVNRTSAAGTSGRVGVIVGLED